ncbi:MerR family transcriptional regulator [Flaviaesturariibacter amylovorans]|uniref:MerR family transcriptional regulator n=1 Tax=Flaviaesturariibacter amylovorans TaxID=1084520 RepID=A0ABP8GUD9_9BACT
MQRFTIRDVENLCHIKAHTLRIWEQRFTFFQSKRKESLHRYYDNDDLQVLLQVAYLYHGGMKISHIATLDATGRLDAIEAQRSHQEPTSEQEVLSMLEAAVTFDEGRFRERLDSVIRRLGLEEAVLKVVFPYLQRVGLLWMTNRIIPAQEHFSSYLLQHRIIAETETLPSPPSSTGEAVLLFTPRDEHHELPLLYLNYLLRKYGWNVIYLGPNVDVRELPEAIVERTSTFYMHLITNLTGFLVDDLLESLCTRYPGKRIIASGSAVLAAQRSFLNVHLLRTDNEILRFVHAGPGSVHRQS